MQTFLGVKVDTATMTVEELEGARTKIQEILAHKRHQIVTSHLACHRYSANNSSNDLKEDQHKFQEMLSNINHQIYARKMSMHRFAR